MKTPIALLTALLSLTLLARAEAAADAARAAFREIYQEMVEIDSSPSTGSCTKVVRAAETRLKAAGFGDAEMHIVIPDGKPDDGNIVARIQQRVFKRLGSNGARVSISVTWAICAEKASPRRCNTVWRSAEASS
jgi:hypothetical protein